MSKTTKNTIMYITIYRYLVFKRSYTFNLFNICQHYLFRGYKKCSSYVPEQVFRIIDDKTPSIHSCVPLLYLPYNSSMVNAFGFKT